VTVLVSLFGFVLSISDWNFARNSVASHLSTRLHRQVRIGGLTARLLSTQPRVHIEKISIANPKWAGNRELAEIESIDVAINLRALLTGDLVLETLVMDQPTVTLIRDAQGRANFQFGDVDGDAGSPPYRNSSTRQIPDWPAVRQFTLNGGNLYVRDEIHKLTFEGTVEADEEAAQKHSTPFQMHGEGTLNGEPFALQFKGGPLANLRMSDPYRFEANVTAGKTSGIAKGEFARPFDFATISSALHIKGENMAYLYYLTGLALPFTPPYAIAGELRSSKQTIAVHNLDGKIGTSDIKGELSIELATDRPKLIAKLQSQSLNLDDLSPAVGKGIRTDRDGDALDSVAPVNLPPDKLFPTYQFQFDRLRSMNADVTLQAASIQAKNIPFKEVKMNLKLNDSILVLDPLIFTLPQGKIVSTVRVDARNPVAQNKLDVRVTDVQLDQFTKGNSEAPLEGVLQARMQITGSGNSVHDMATSANGQLNAVLPSGEVRKAFAELAGINVANGLGLLLAKDQSRSAVRCGIAVLDIHDGNADVKQMVFDTESVVIKGDGHIDLGPEKVDLDIKGHPKKLRLARLRTPITVKGTIRKPTIGIDPGEATKQAGIAAALGSLLTPLTAALAFIDPGLAKDENCAALVTEVEKAQSLQAFMRDTKSSSTRVN
jgi:uncharacterized protein involved in outer membrane biogenesis